MDPNKEAMLKKILYACIIVYIITLVASFYTNLQSGNSAGVGMSALAMVTPLIVPIVFRLLHFKPVYEIYIISTIFTYFASLVGSGFHWYSFMGFDKVLHFASGWMFTTVAVILFFTIRGSNKLHGQKDSTIFLIFINAVNMAIGVIWEFFEYFMLIFFDNDGINHYSQGVHDTMTDIMCATVGGILLTMLIMRYMQKGKASFFTNVYEKFYTRNIAHGKERKS